MIWAVLTILSPVLAFICWYSKGGSKIAAVISAGIVAVLFNMTFSYGWIYFDIQSVLELLVFICGIIVLRRTTIKETIIVTAIGMVLAFAIHIVIPFRFG